MLDTDKALWSSYRHHTSASFTMVTTRTSTKAQHCQAMVLRHHHTIDGLSLNLKVYWLVPPPLTHTLPATQLPPSTQTNTIMVMQLSLARETPSTPRFAALPRLASAQGFEHGSWQGPAQYSN